MLFGDVVEAYAVETAIQKETTSKDDASFVLFPCEIVGEDMKETDRSGSVVSLLQPWSLGSISDVKIMHGATPQAAKRITSISAASPAVSSTRSR